MPYFLALAYFVKNGYNTLGVVCNLIRKNKRRRKWLII
jgi:hypothetical protein